MPIAERKLTVIELRLSELRTETRLILSAIFDTAGPRKEPSARLGPRSDAGSEAIESIADDSSPLAPPGANVARRSWVTHLRRFSFVIMIN